MNIEYSTACSVIIGLCEINENDEFKGKNWGKEVRKTELLDMMFAFEEPQFSN